MLCFRFGIVGVLPIVFKEVTWKFNLLGSPPFSQKIISEGSSGIHYRSSMIVLIQCVVTFANYVYEEDKRRIVRIVVFLTDV